MKKTIEITILLLFIISISLSGQNEKLKPLWVKKDKKNFVNLTKFLSQKNLSILDFKSRIKNLDIRQETEIWHKSKRISAAQYGGYISNWITFTSFENRIFSIRILIRGKDAQVMKKIAEKDKTIKLELEKNWTYSKTTDSDENVIESYSYEYINERIKKQFENKIAEELGGLKEIKIDEELKNSYNILIDPMENYDYGKHCYYGGSKPKGRIAIEKLVEAKRFDLVKNIIRGYNPEGRAYGIEVLIAADKRRNRNINTDDGDIIKRLLSTNFKVNLCDGCFVMQSTYKEIFKRKK